MEFSLSPSRCDCLRNGMCCMFYSWPFRRLLNLSNRTIVSIYGPGEAGEVPENITDVEESTIAALRVQRGERESNRISFLYFDGPVTSVKFSDINITDLKGGRSNEPDSILI